MSNRLLRPSVSLTHAVISSHLIWRAPRWRAIDHDLVCVEQQLRVWPSRVCDHRCRPVPPLPPLALLPRHGLTRATLLAAPPTVCHGDPTRPHPSSRPELMFDDYRMEDRCQRPG